MITCINQLSGKAYLKRISEMKNPTVIIPTGACEMYGPHLPLGSDLLVAKAISELVAEKVGALVAPTIEIGESNSSRSSQATFVAPRKLMEDWYETIFKILWEDGFRNFVFLTGHSGNVAIVTDLIKNIIHEPQYADLKVCQVDVWRFTQSHSGVLDYTGMMAHGHAAECGTSVMMYLYPELVDMDELTSNVPPAPVEGKDTYSDIIQYDFFKHFFGEKGMLGDATTATREKGEAVVKECVDRIASYIQEKMY